MVATRTPSLPRRRDGVASRAEARKTRATEGAAEHRLQRMHRRSPGPLPRFAGEGEHDCSCGTYAAPSTTISRPSSAER